MDKDNIFYSHYTLINIFELLTDYVKEHYLSFKLRLVYKNSQTGSQSCCTQQNTTAIQPPSTQRRVTLPRITKTCVRLQSGGLSWTGARYVRIFIQLNRRPHINVGHFQCSYDCAIVCKYYTKRSYTNR